MLSLILSIALLFAGTPTSIAEHFAQAEEVAPNWFENLKVEKQKDAFKVTFFRSHGDGGGEDCQALYNLQGQLTKHFCKLRYVSHSLSTENARTEAQLMRQFSPKGEAKVLGKWKKTRLRDKKVMEDKSITSLKDENIQSFCKVVRSLPPKLLVKESKIKHP